MRKPNTRTLAVLLLALAGLALPSCGGGGKDHGGSMIWTEDDWDAEEWG